MLTPLVHAGILYADARANAVFLLGDTPATAVGAELRGTTSVSWRGMAPGSRKDHGCFSRVRRLRPSHRPVRIGHRCPQLPRPSSDLSLPLHLRRQTRPCLAAPLLPMGLPIFCGFDADPTGEAMAQRLIQLHPSIRRLRPPAKDWNDALRSPLPLTVAPSSPRSASSVPTRNSNLPPWKGNLSALQPGGSLLMSTPGSIFVSGDALNDDGVMHVVKAGPKYELVARNELGEKTYASPALSDGQMFLRGFKNLYCIGKPAK